MVHIKNLLLVILIGMFIISCNNTNKPTKDADAFDDIEVENTITTALDFPMPSAVEVVKLLNETGAGFIYDATNPPENVENYLSYKQKAINLGIYGADLSYTITYGKKNETAAYLDNFVQLIEDLEISNLDKEFFLEVQNNLDEKDSLIIIVKKAIYDTHEYLKETNKDEIALFALSGSWVESLYLVGTTVKYAQNKKPLLDLLLSHKKDLNSIITLMESHKDNKDFKDLYNQLNEINDLFTKIEGKITDYRRAEDLKDKIIEFRNTLI
ncbi:MAG: hypothetical protein JEZ09_10345 [Salinivirgaceae bacterium]|nr:hypothetical protein [Salinivirgaceae bacterium]